MDMTGEHRIPAPREAVWEALNDPEILKQCIPGCEELTKISDTEFDAQVVAKVGPVKAKFGGKVTLSDLDPPNGYKITGEGQGGAAGFAKGGAEVRWTDDGDGTLLKYDGQCRDRRQARADRLAADRRHRAQDGRRFLHRVRRAGRARGGPAPRRCRSRRNAGQLAAGAEPADGARRRPRRPHPARQRANEGLPPVVMGRRIDRRRRRASLVVPAIGYVDYTVGNRSMLFRRAALG